MHSTGIVEANNKYTAVSVVHDTAGYDYPDLLQVIAAGNCGVGTFPPFCGKPATKQLTSQAVVKNALTVGASQDVLAPNDRASFSSAGPTFDGRWKPDILAPGTDLVIRDFPFVSQLVHEISRRDPFNISANLSSGGAAKRSHTTSRDGINPPSACRWDSR